MNFSILVANNNRAKCYFQNLLANGYIPDEIIYISDSKNKLPEQTENDLIYQDKTQQRFYRSSTDLKIKFDEKEHVLETARKFRVTVKNLPDGNINSLSNVSFFNSLSCDFILYAGRGGVIIKPHIIDISPKFLHVHPGILPEYKGSTTVYYSQLAEGKIGASVIYMEAKLDSGPILFTNSYKITEYIDFDYCLDPMVRTAALLDYLDGHAGLPVNDCVEEGMFYIAHPCIRHLAVTKFLKGL